MLHGLEAFDWTLSNHESRMALYHFTLNLAENGLIDKKMDRFFAEAFREYKGSHTGFKDSFRKGKAGSDKLAMVARQIGKQFPERVPILIEQLQLVWPREKDHYYWEQFVELNATFSNVEVLKVEPNSLNIVGFKTKEPISKIKLKIGDGFCFQIDSPFDSHAFAMQSLNHAWFKLPLPRKKPIIPITQGKQIIPNDPICCANSVIPRLMKEQPSARIAEPPKVGGNCAEKPIASPVCCYLPLYR